MNLDNPQRWRVSKLVKRRGRYLNSPLVEEWRECGYVRAEDEERAAAKAMFAVGSSCIRVEPVSEFYRPGDSIP